MFMSCRCLTFTESFFASGCFIGHVELQRLEMSDSKEIWTQICWITNIQFCWEPGQVLIVNPSSELILVSLTEPMRNENTGKELCLQNKMDFRQSRNAPDLQKQNAFTNGQRSQIILQLIFSAQSHNQKHTSTRTELTKHPGVSSDLFQLLLTQQLALLIVTSESFLKKNLCKTKFSAKLKEIRRIPSSISF